jgi:phenylalanyl-tRNA synthetase beta chain
MPTVNLKRDELFNRLQKRFTEQEFDELCFEFGIELDEVTSAREIQSKFLGQKDPNLLDESSDFQENATNTTDMDDDDDQVIYKIDIPANRYDLLCMEGIARALNVFRGQRSTPVFRLCEPVLPQRERLRVKVNKNCALVRPFIVCAVLRNVTFTKERYASFIDLQDKLHQNICRRRSLVAIGTHDLAKIEGPFSYDAKPKDEISFVPLKQTKQFRVDELLEHYKKNDQKLKAFVPLIESSAVVPVLTDARGTVLSLPPLINGSVSAISLETKDVFIECTATDLHKAKIVLNTVVTMFSEHCANPFQVEPVDVVDFMGNERSYPDFMTRFVDVDVDYVNKRIGTEIGTKEMAALLCKMQLASKVTAEKTLRVEIPPTRSDVMHACDIAEDVAIAYGYNNIKQTIPKASTMGKGQPINHFGDLVREEIARMGFSEVLTWILCSHDDNFKNVKREDDGNSAAIVANPSSIDVQVARNSLLPGVLKALRTRTLLCQ